MRFFAGSRLVFLVLGMLALAGGLLYWQASTLREMRDLPGHTEMVFAVAFSADGKLGLSAGGCSSSNGTFRDCVARLWDLETGQEIRKYEGHRGAVFGVAFTPNGQRLLTASEDHTLAVWETATGARIQELKGHTGEVRCVAMSPDGKHALSGGTDGAIRLWDLETFAEVARAQVSSFGTVYGVAFSPDGGRAASAGSDGAVKVWETATLHEKTAFRDNPAAVLCVAFAPDGKRLASGGFDNVLRLHDLEAGQTIQECRGHEDAVIALAFTPDGSKVLSAGGFMGKDISVRLWNLASGRQTNSHRREMGTVNSVAISPTGATALYGAGGGVVKLLRLPSL
jgi:WD40 repeat protein